MQKRPNAPTDSKPTGHKDAEINPYILELTSRYHEQLAYLKARKDQIKRLSILYTLLAGASAVAVMVSSGFITDAPYKRILITLLPTYSFILAAVYYFQYSSIQSKISQTLEKIRLDELLGRIAPLGASEPKKTNNEEYFDKLVKINVENLSAYYAQVKEHANKSFVTSLIMSVIGFAIITTGLVIAFYSHDQKSLIVFVSSAAGIITEMISALFFYLYTQTVHQMKGYHDGLLYVQNILLCLKLIEGPEGLKGEMKFQAVNKLIEYLLKNKAPQS
jgi:uncharacterized membrane protein